MPTIQTNKRAAFDYEFLAKYEAGIMLTGSEVKSVKTGHLNLSGSFVTLHGNELFLTNANIPPYPHASKLENYNPSRSRKLLLKKSEIRALIGKVRTQGLTLVPIRVYTKKRLLKLEFALAKGKKSFDKRQAIRQREDDRQIRRSLKNN